MFPDEGMERDMRKCCERTDMDTAVAVHRNTFQFLDGANPDQTASGELPFTDFDENVAAAGDNDSFRVLHTGADGIIQ